MNQREFEERVLQLWMTTRVPMTRANLLYYSRAPRKKVGEWLDEMVGDGVLEVDADDDGEMVWAVRGAKRPDSGPQRIEDLGEPPQGKEAGTSDLASRLDKLRKEALGSAGGLVLASQAGRGAAALLKPRHAGDKSLIASGLLSFFFGPLGLLYAAPLKTAVPAVLLYILACSILPAFLLNPLLAIGAPLFGLAGLAYAWRHNQKGERVPLLGSDDEKPPALPKRR